jgi:hypothetical protein
MMNKYFRLWLCLFVFYSSSCKDIYSPALDEAQKMLVVDGLLSDESNVITVHLSNAVPFRDQAYLPEQAAVVVVSDDLGRDFDFSEKSPGYYESKNFHYEYGRTYILVIKTKKNKYYKSSPQTLYPKSKLDSVSAFVTSKTLQTTKDGKLILKNLSGLEFSTILKDSSISSPYYRFSSNVLLEYTEREVWTAKPDSVPLFFNCWKKYFPDEFFNLSDQGYINLKERVQSLAFCPIDSTYFTMGKEEIWIYSPPPPKLILTYFRNIYNFAITIKKYRINADVHKYYSSINEQIEAKNRIFDPVSFQVRGNITCDNDPEEPVLGVFEVSSTSVRSYSFSDFQFDKRLKYKEINPLNIEDLPATGRVYNRYPSFWILNK